jgi:hypothetical protein
VCEDHNPDTHTGSSVAEEIIRRGQKCEGKQCFSAQAEFALGAMSGGILFTTMGWKV